MFTSMFSSLSEGLGLLLDGIVRAFLQNLGLNLSQYLTYFPFLNNLYLFLQTVALGLIVIIAGKQLAMFWLGAVDSTYMQDRPVNIILRSFIAAIAVYFGGYILELIVHLGTIPFNDLIATQAHLTDDWSLGVALGDAATGIARSAGADFTATQGASDMAVGLCTFLITILIAFNLFKLMLEVAERYLMVGVLVFTSPVIYPTIATKNSSQIFRKWLSMFTSAVIMMSVSVAFLKLIINGMVHLSEEPYMMRLLMVLAMCKIAQRADTYLGQLGLNTAITGSNMLDDIIAMGKMTNSFLGGGGGGGKRSGRPGILGHASAVMSRTPLGRATSAYRNARAGGGGVRESFRAGAHAAGRGYLETFAPAAAVAAGIRAHRNGGTAGQVAAASAGAAASAVGHTVSNMVAPRMMNEHDAAVQANEERTARRQQDGQAQQNGNQQQPNDPQQPPQNNQGGQQQASERTQAEPVQANQRTSVRHDQEADSFDRQHGTADRVVPDDVINNARRPVDARTANDNLKSYGAKADALTDEKTANVYGCRTETDSAGNEILVGSSQEALGQTLRSAAESIERMPMNNSGEAGDAVDAAEKLVRSTESTHLTPNAAEAFLATSSDGTYSAADLQHYNDARDALSQAAANNDAEAYMAAANDMVHYARGAAVIQAAQVMYSPVAQGTTGNGSTIEAIQINHNGQRGEYNTNVTVTNRDQTERASVDVYNEAVAWRVPGGQDGSRINLSSNGRFRQRTRNRQKRGNDGSWNDATSS